MLKHLLFCVALFSLLYTSTAKTIVLGSNGKDQITMTYVERQADEALRLRFRMQKSEPLKYDRSAAAVCCTESITMNTQPVNTDNNNTGGNTNGGDNNGGNNTEEEPLPEDNSRNLQQTTETEGENAGGDTENTNAGGEGTQETKFDPKSNIGKCFGASFTCGIPGGCKGSTELGLVLYQSTIEGKTWKAATNDYSATNVGSANLGTGTDFSTRFSMNLKQAQESSVPLIGVDYTTKLYCYVAYDVARGDVQFSLNIDLSNESIWNYIDNVEVKVSEDELSEENVVSGAMQQIVPIGILVTLVTLFTTL